MMELLDGAKTFLGGLVLIGGGVAGAFFGIIDPLTAASAVGAGLSVWGLGHKIEKLTDAVKANKPTTFKNLIPEESAAFKNLIPEEPAQ